MSLYAWLWTLYGLFQKVNTSFCINMNWSFFSTEFPCFSAQNDLKMNWRFVISLYALGLSNEMFNERFNEMTWWNVIVKYEKGCYIYVTVDMLYSINIYHYVRVVEFKAQRCLLTFVFHTIWCILSFSYPQFNSFKKADIRGSRKGK